MSIKTIEMNAELYKYLLSISLHESKTLQALRKKTHHLKNYRMQISPEQGQFMAWLMPMIDAKKTLDIGTYTGYSALVIALALPEDGIVITCDVNETSTTLAKQFWQEAHVSHKIKLHLRPALETLQALIDQGESHTFDFAFIDADKENYQLYYEQCLRLVRTNGIIAIDNVLWGGKVTDSAIQDASTKAIRKLNEFIYQDDRVSITLLPIGDGLMLARKL